VSDAPLSDSEAAALLARFAHLGPLILAVSGGPDSTAMMGLCARIRAGMGDVVVTVDHGLRPESRDEAEAVGAFARALGHDHAILTWQGDKPATAVQEKARVARYELMRGFLEQRGLAGVMLAHTLDDQAETVLMRLMGGSGLRGLGGMEPVTERAGVMLCRPFLGVSKARLVATCEARGWRFASDPSNDNPAFLRPRLRRLMPLLAEEGLTAERLATFAARAREADRALDTMARSALLDSDAALRDRARHGVLHAPTLLGRSREQAVRMLEIGIRAYAPEEVLVLPLEALEAMAGRLITAMDNEQGHIGTIAGIKVVLAGDVVRFTRTPPRRRGLFGKAR